MAKSPNTTPISSMFVQWTQPYVAMEGFFRDKTCEEIYNDEILSLEATDKLVNEMLTYPEADAILNKIRKESK